MVHKKLAALTLRLKERSKTTRQDYLARMEHALEESANLPDRARLPCSNLAHGFAACKLGDKQKLSDLTTKNANIAIVSAYNDMLSAHQPFKDYPEIIKRAIEEVGGVAQFAGGVPALCDGMAQGMPSMELSLFSRDIIALATAISLSHQMFDGVICLGTCDKIVPGLLIGALAFGHLPTVFIPAGPMVSGLGNKEKAKYRELYLQKKISKAELLAAESKAYHAPGTCTFYGTANTNQLLLEFLGLHLPGSTFINPHTAERERFTNEAAKRILELTKFGKEYTPLGQIISEESIVNSIVALMATGGSTNHTIHLIAIARAAGIILELADFAEISSLVPLCVRIYPNGEADVNALQRYQGINFLIKELLAAGLLHDNVKTIVGTGLEAYAEVSVNPDPQILRPVSEPFKPTGGVQLLQGNLGQAIIKTSALLPEHLLIKAPARIFDSQEEVLAAMERQELASDMVVVVRGQGPRANGMPELHKLTPALGILLDRGYKVGLLTDGRMSGASGRVPAAIHVTPEYATGGPLSLLRDGDIIQIDALNNRLVAEVPEAIWKARESAVSVNTPVFGVGRELFQFMRQGVGAVTKGASILFPE